MKLIVAGSREFNDYDLLKRSIQENFQRSEVEEIVSGTARGADTLGEQFAKEYSIPVKQFPANWDLYGKSAGYRRNAEMANYADALIAFWNGESKGTMHMINLAKEKNLKVVIISV
jgi:hypothetical protein